MERYNSYKDSGVEWIGKIPSSWVKTKLKYKLQEVVTGGTPDTSNDSFWSDEDKGINWISISDITSNGREITGTKKFISEKGLESKKLKILPIGSLIYSIYGSIGKISRLGIPSTVHQGILGLKTNSTYNTTFLEYYLIYFKEYVSLFSSSNTQENLNQEKVSNFDIPVPPLSEQQQIVSFLDTKTSLIDSLIEKTLRKIELLKEKRTTLINELVTKGLNPNVKMKDSGVECIGKIPSHWDRLPLKNFGQVTLGKMLTSEDKGGYHLKPYLRSKNIQIERVNTSDVKEMWFSDTELEKLRLEKGDLLFNEGGDVGRTCIWLNEIDECYIQNSVNRVRFENDYERYYLHLSILYHSVGYYDSLVNRVSIPHLTKEKLESVIFLRPPLNEQKQIVEYLDEQTQKIDKTISIEEKRIELLEEYRQSLISEVVTGKRKVV